MSRPHTKKNQKTPASRLPVAPDVRIDAPISAQPLSEAPKRQRNFGKTSPLDLLPAKVKQELRKRCAKGEAFRTIRAWLLNAHQLTTSQTSLCVWWKERANLSEAMPMTGRRFQYQTLEITVQAPGATEVRVLVRPR